MRVRGQPERHCCCPGYELEDCLEYHPVAGGPTAAGLETGGAALASNETFESLPCSIRHTRCIFQC